MTSPTPTPLTDELPPEPTGFKVPTFPEPTYAVWKQDYDELRAYAVRRLSSQSETVERFQSISDNSYCDYIARMSRPECLGWEAKVKAGQFGKRELDAHNRAAEMLGRHQAFHEVVQVIRSLQAAPEHSEEKK